MARPIISNPSDADIEVWEAATSATTWVYVFDRREDRYLQVRVGGRSGSRRLNITRDDRKYNQELLPFENTKNDPFTNGTLRFLESATRDELLDTRYHMTDDQLLSYFEVRNVELFMDAVKDIESEIVLRKLQRMAPDNATVAQVDAINAYIRERFPQGGSQKAVREMEEVGERLGVSDL